MSIERISNPSQVSDDTLEDRGLRPSALSEFTGQNALKKNLSIAIEAAQLRRDPIDHSVFTKSRRSGK